MIKYEDVQKYRNKIAGEMDSILGALEKHIIEKRDKGDLPSCTSKWRVKSVESIYLKTKIKGYENIEDLKKITDYGGIRFLVLFEEDLHAVHKELLRYFSDKKISVKEFKLFNWDDADRESRFYNDIENILLQNLDEREKKEGDVVRPESGYRSIHYLVCIKPEFHIEIQLRTYLQDVWGELEHSLVYKNGTINPFVRQSFVRLAKELAIHDSNVQYLYGISKKEVAFNRSVRKYEILTAYLMHNCSLLSPEDVNGDLYKKYVAHARLRPQRNLRDDWVKQGRKMLLELQSKLKGNSAYIALWQTTEEAFWMFQNGELEEGRAKCKVAETLRGDIKPDWGYSINMRIGESYCAQGNMARALVEFDKSESLITQATISGDAANIYRLKIVMAYHYWMFGSKMYDIALEKVCDAKQIFEKYKADFPQDELKKTEFVTINNLCWYLLEVCIRDYQSIRASLGDVGMDRYIMKDPEDVNLIIDPKKKIFLEKFSLLLKTLCDLVRGLDVSISSNSYDTVAWAFYNICLMMESGFVLVNDLLIKQEDLKEIGFIINKGDDVKLVVANFMRASEDYAQKMMREGDNAATLIEYSRSLQHVHLQEIFNWINEKKASKAN